MPEGSCPFLMVGGVPVVTAPTEIDASTAGQLRAALTGWAARGHTTVVVNLAGTQFCDCTGLHVLARAHQHAQAKGGGLQLVLPASGPVLRLGVWMTMEAGPVWPSISGPDPPPRMAGKRERLSGGEFAYDLTGPACARACLFCGAPVFVQARRVAAG